MIPTTDVLAFGQRVLMMIRGMLMVSLVMKVGGFLYKTFKAPAYLVTLWVILTYFPDTVAWIFITIGQIQLKCMMIMMNVIMPHIFAEGGEQIRTWSDVWQAGINVLPQDMVDVINGVGVADILGIITATYASGFMIKCYRRAMERAGLM